MAAREGQGQHCVPFKLTLLGPAQSGKTSLATAFVNNFTPSVYTPTLSPVLYYKTLYLTVGKDAKHSAGEAFPVLAEIEDTYAVDCEGGEDDYGMRRDSGYFYGRFATKKDYSKWSADLDGPPELFESRPAPRWKRYRPISLIRMGFMIVFDAGDDASLDDAKVAYADLVEALKKEQDMVKEKVQPVIALVANKVDRGSTRVDFVCEGAQHFANEQGIEFYKVSALELKKVKELFRKVLAKVYEQRTLWDLGGKYRMKRNVTRKMEAMQQKVLASGRNAIESGLESGQRAVRAGQENCGVQ